MSTYIRDVHFTPYTVHRNTVHRLPSHTVSNPRMPFSIFRKIASLPVAAFNFLKKCIAPASEGLNFRRAIPGGPKTYYLYIASILYFMKLIHHLREFYGFPQAVLAQYVGVSRGHLSMAAIGRKDLQTAAFLKLPELPSGDGWIKTVKRQPLNWNYRPVG